MRRPVEERYRLLVESVTDYAIYMLDPLGRVASWNAGAERIKGWRAEEIIGRSYAEFYTPEDRAAGLPQRNLEIAGRTGRCEGEGWRVRRDGSRFWAMVVIDAIRDGEGRLIGFAKISRDMTARRDADAELEAARRQMLEAQKMEAVAQVARGVAHDFNNRLAVVLGSLELIEHRYSVDAGIKALVDRATEAGKRGALLVQQLLSFCRQATLTPKLLHVDLEGIRPLLSSALGDQIKLTIHQETDLWPTLVDIVQLHAALLNLCLNARDALAGKGEVSVSASNRPGCEGDYVVIEVRDSGPGMSQETASKAFAPFFTTKGPKHSGLGLSQVQGFVSQSDGYVTLNSVEGQGTTVGIFLRRAEVAAEVGKAA
jgi:PAS domain S-box-containing protein